MERNRSNVLTAARHSHGKIILSIMLNSILENLLTNVPPVVPKRCKFSVNFCVKVRFKNSIFCFGCSTRKEHLLNHINKPHKCQFCQKAFTRKEHLSNHMRHHTSSDSSHVCTVCSKPFGRKEHLINHMR